MTRTDRVNLDAVIRFRTTRTEKAVLETAAAMEEMRLSAWLRKLGVDRALELAADPEIPMDMEAEFKVRLAAALSEGPPGLPVEPHTVADTTTTAPDEPDPGPLTESTSSEGGENQSGATAAAPPAAAPPADPEEDAGDGEHSPAPLAGHAEALSKEPLYNLVTSPSLTLRRAAIERIGAGERLQEGSLKLMSGESLALYRAWIAAVGDDAENSVSGGETGGPSPAPYVAPDEFGEPEPFDPPADPFGFDS